MDILNEFSPLTCSQNITTKC